MTGNRRNRLTKIKKPRDVVHDCLLRGLACWPPPRRFGRGFGADAGFSCDGQGCRPSRRRQDRGAGAEGLKPSRQSRGLRPDRGRKRDGLASPRAASGARPRCFSASLRSGSGGIEEAADFLAADTKDQSLTACLRAAPESILERIFLSLAPVAGLIASRHLMLRAPRGGFERLAGFVAPSTAFHTRARRIG
jgi:hypothetical protein